MKLGLTIIFFLAIFSSFALAQTIEPQAILEMKRVQTAKIFPASLTASQTKFEKVKKVIVKYVPPVFEEIQEEVLVRPAYEKWIIRKNNRSCCFGGPETCRVWALKEMPPEYETITVQRLRSPAQYNMVEIPLKK